MAEANYSTYYKLGNTFTIQKHLESIHAIAPKIEGRKFDGGKLQYGLIPPNALKATVEILTFGAEKYEPDNWKKVPDAERRYFDAMQRHLWAWKSGEQNDQETGKNHLAHALCCLMFLYEHDTIDFLNNGEVNETIK